MSRIFLSHSRKDTIEAVALKGWLVEQDPSLRADIFLDVDPDAGNAPGEEWKKQLNRALERSEAVICLLSKNWESSGECVSEFRFAEYLGKQILCARLEDETGSRTNQWQHCDLFVDGLSARDVVTVAGADAAPVRFARAGLHALCRAARGAGAGSFTWPPRNDPHRAPFRGWQPFKEVDAGIFYGRDAELVRTMEALRSMRRSSSDTLYVLLGPSGSGKSSFMRAGLIPRLLRDDNDFAVLGTLRPGRQPLTGDTGLAQAIHTGRCRVDLTSPTLGEVKAACDSRDTARLTALLAECADAAAQSRSDAPVDAAAPTLVLPLDQAEELFGANAGEEAEALLQLMAELTAATEFSLIVVATMRADRYEALCAAEELEQVGVRVGDLRPMSPAHFETVVTGPAGRASHPLTPEPELISELLSDATNASQGGDALPLLSVTLARLYNDFGSAGTLTLEQYRAMGGLRRVVQTEIDEVLSADPATRNLQLAQLQAAFIPWLATVDPDTDLPLRRLARWDEIPETSRGIVEAFVEKRLLVMHARRSAASVEIALESLLRQWDQLATWLRLYRDDLITADHVRRAAADWEANNCDESYLLQGSRLLSAQQLAAEPLFRDHIGSIRGFIGASQNQEEERQDTEKQHRQAELGKAKARTRFLWVLVALLIAVVVVVVVSFQSAASTQKAEASARQTIAMRLDSEAESMLSGENAGGDARAFQEILAAKALTNGADGDALHAAAVRENTVKVNDTGLVQTVTAFRPDGEMFATGGEDFVRLWDAGTLQPAGPALDDRDGWVYAVAFSPDGRRLAAVGSTKLRLWDADTGRLVFKIDAGERDVKSVVFSPDGSRLATAGADNTVRLWDAASGRPIGSPMGGHTSMVNCLAFSPDGRRLISGSSDGSLRQWDDSGKLLQAIGSGHGAVYEVAYRPDGQLVASAGGDGTIRIWDPDITKYVGSFLTGHTGSVLGLAFSQDGRHLASGGYDNTVRVWDVETREQVGPALLGHTSHVGGVAFAPEGHRLVSTGDDGTIRLWNIDEPLVGHDNLVEQVAFSPDGALLASASSDNTVRLWNAATGIPTGHVLQHPESVFTIAFSPDGRLLATGGADETVRFWDPATGAAAGPPLTGHTGAVFAVKFSPDGRLVASTGADKSIRLWDVRTRTPVGEPLTEHTSSVTGLAFSPTGNQLASSSTDNTVRLWDLTARKPVAKTIYAHGNWVFAVAFSPDGSRVASASADNTVKFWDSRTGEEVGRPLTGHIGAVRSIEFSPDGMSVATASDDKTVRLWDASTAILRGPPFSGHTSAVASVAFSPDGGQLATGGDDFIVRRWPATVTTDTLCGKLVNNMSHDQWRNWISPDVPYVVLCPALPVPG